MSSISEPVLTVRSRRRKRRKPAAPKIASGCEPYDSAPPRRSTRLSPFRPARIIPAVGMSSIVDAPRAFRRGHRAAPPLAARLRPALPLIAVTIAAIVLRLLMVTATDVSWLITLSEKVLDGTRLYVDLIEVNPPASVLLYLPAVALARWVGRSGNRGQRARVPRRGREPLDHELRSDAGAP